MPNSYLPTIFVQRTEYGWNAWISIGGVMCTPTFATAGSENEAIQLSLERFVEEMRGHAPRERLP